MSCHWTRGQVGKINSAPRSPLASLSRIQVQISAEVSGGGSSDVQAEKTVNERHAEADSRDRIASHRLLTPQTGPTRVSKDRRTGDGMSLCDLEPSEPE